ncbi:MAG TPA: hypothetical protein VGE53_02350 [Candidatus Paceibacterota bacterium]
MNRTGLIVLIIAIIGLLVLFFAFNRPAMDEARENTEDMATTTASAMNQTATRAEAAAELTALRARVEAGETYADLQEDFARVRARVATSYENAEGAAADEWAEVQADFDNLEASARAGTSSFLDSLASLIARLSADVRVESETE